LIDLLVRALSGESWKSEVMQAEFRERDVFSELIDHTTLAQIPGRVSDDLIRAADASYCFTVACTKLTPPSGSSVTKAPQRVFESTIMCRPS
jgi:hypothetical protein